MISAVSFADVFGLPAHPLLVHAAVVLVPLAALALIGVGWNRAWRRPYYLPITLLAIAGAGATLLAKQTGESLAESVRQAGKRVGEHPEQGDTAFVFAALFAMACAALWLYDAYGEEIRARLGLSERLRLPVDENLALYLTAVPIAVLAIVTIVVAGHSGATLVWKTNR
jgi:hypothetical protein